MVGRAMSERGGSMRSGSVARAVGGALGVHGGALVLHIGDEATLVVRPVSDDLDPAVRERHPVLPGHHAVLVLDLFLGKISS